MSFAVAAPIVVTILGIAVTMALGWHKRETASEGVKKTLLFLLTSTAIIVIILCADYELRFQAEKASSVDINPIIQEGTVQTFQTETPQPLQPDYGSSEPKYTDWSDWEELTYNIENPPQFGETALTKVEDLGETQVFFTFHYQQGSAIMHDILHEIGKITEMGYKGIICFQENGILYGIKEDEEWQIVGNVVLSERPLDTLVERYTFVGAEYEHTEEEAIATRKVGTTTIHYWQKEIRKKGIIKTKEQTIKFPLEADIPLVTEQKEVQLYMPIPVVAGYETERIPLYKEVYRYRIKTRNVVLPGDDK